MRRHSWSIPVLPVATTATVLVAACGAGARLAADSPDQVLVGAFQAARRTPLVMSFTGSFSLDSAGLKNVPASLQPGLARLGSGGAASGLLTQASSSRRELSVSVDGHTDTLVQYDGHGYARQDGGGFAELPKALPSAPGLSSATLSAAVGALDFQDQGPAAVAGQRTEHYRAGLSVTSLDNLATALGGSAPSGSRLGQMIPMLIPFVSLQGASADVWVSQTTGGLVEASVGGSFSVDVGKIAAAFAGFVASGAPGSLPSGTLSGSLHLAIQVTRYGGSITIAKPVATATLPARGPGWMSGSAGAFPWTA